MCLFCDLWQMTLMSFNFPLIFCLINIFFLQKFLPKTNFNEETNLSEAILVDLINTDRVKDAITVYEKISEDNNIGKYYPFLNHIQIRVVLLSEVFLRQRKNFVM